MTSCWEQYFFDVWNWSHYSYIKTFLSKLKWSYKYDTVKQQILYYFTIQSIASSIAFVIWKMCSMAKKHNLKWKIYNQCLLLIWFVVSFYSHPFSTYKIVFFLHLRFLEKEKIFTPSAFSLQLLHPIALLNWKLWVR